jgi:uncharacterized protein (TIGR01777 family)
MKILVSGSTGLVGSALIDRLRDQGQEVIRLVRPASRSEQPKSDPRPGEKAIVWDPANSTLDSSAEGVNAVVHLAGASIVGGRWTAARKRLLRDSRVATTHNLVAALGKLSRPPRAFIAASAIGYYGDRRDEQLAESSTPGTNFLADLTHDWETESSRATEFGSRVAMLRFGIILAQQGGALAPMVLPFRLGIGGRVGSGRQWMSWIALEDIVEIIRFAITTEEVAGPVNAVSPNPIQNAEFARELAAVLHRPALFPAPAFALRLALGRELAQTLLLSSQRVFPKRLAQWGYRFLWPELKPALDAILRN